MKRDKLIIVTLTLLFGALLAIFSVVTLGEYGLTLFLFIPFSFGFFPSFYLGRKYAISRKEMFKISFVTLMMSVVMLIACAMEGIICILMSLPILSFCTALGVLIAHLVLNYLKGRNRQVYVLVGAMATSLMSFDLVQKENGLNPVSSSVVIWAPVEVVWENVVAFDSIKAPVDWFFKTGIAYPTHAEIIGEGKGAIRYCNFSTGSFVEPITVWDEPRLLAFDVVDQPIPMNEFNPFWDIHPPHLDGYFKSEKGQFELISRSDGAIELKGTTWYRVDIYPEFYWKIWSDFIIHRIHKRVLLHIKMVSENA